MLYNSKVKRYKAVEGKKQYLEKRKRSAPRYQCLEKASFLELVVGKVRNDCWSLDACVGYALSSGLFTRKDIVCTKTLEFLSRSIEKCYNLRYNIWEFYQDSPID